MGLSDYRSGTISARDLVFTAREQRARKMRLPKNTEVRVAADFAAAAAASFFLEDISPRGALLGRTTTRAECALRRKDSDPKVNNDQTW